MVYGYKEMGPRIIPKGCLRHTNFHEFLYIGTEYDTKNVWQKLYMKKKVIRLLVPVFQFIKN